MKGIVYVVTSRENGPVFATMDPELSALLMPEGYVMPSFYNIIDGEILAEVDNMGYLTAVIFKYLKNELLEDNEEWQYCDDTFSNFKEELLEIFNAAEKLGFFKNKI